jgi:nucleotide-binding universal stress UspA family protein
MKILATFDGSAMSESALGQLQKIARVGDEIVLLSVVESKPGLVRMRGPLRPSLRLAPGPGSISDGPAQPSRSSDDAEAAIRRDYLCDLATRLPPGLACSCEVTLHDDPARAIIERALSWKADLIVMTTHGRTGLVHILFGDVAEEIVRSGVAPVLLVHPDTVSVARGAKATTGATGSARAAR